MKKIKTGVLAYGFSGSVFHCPFIEAHDAYELTAVVQRHGTTAKNDYPNIELYKDYQELLDDDEIELIIITTPAHLHFKHAMMALEAGKHVVIEKPFASSLEDATQLFKVAKEKNCLLTAYLNRRFDGDFLTIKQLMKDGLDIYEYEAVWDRNVPMIDKTDWHEQGHKGSDLLFDIGSHFLDQALTLFGEPVDTYGIAKQLRPGSQINDYFSLELVYKDKVVRLKSCMHASKSDIRYKIHTNKGTYYFYEMGEQEQQLMAGMKPNDPSYGDNALYDCYDLEGKKTSHQVILGNYLAYYTELAQAIRNNGPTPVSEGDIIRLTKMLESFSI